MKPNPQVQYSTKSYSKSTTKPPAAKSPNNWVMVKSASDLFQDVPEIPLNINAANINSKSLLAIKIRCEDSTPPGIYKPNATSLGEYSRILSWCFCVVESLVSEMSKSYLGYFFNPRMNSLNTFCMTLKLL